MEIKALHPADAPVIAELSRLVYNVCLRRGVRYPEMNTYFEEYTEAAALAERMEKGTLFVWGAVEDQMICGVGGMNADGQITILYVHPDYQGRHFGRNLLERMRQYAAVTLCLPKVIVNAAPAFTGDYFRRQGFLRLDIRQTPQSPYMTLTADTIYLKEYPRKQVPGWVIGTMACGTALLSFLILFGYAVFFTIMH